MTPLSAKLMRIPFLNRWVKHSVEARLQREYEQDRDEGANLASRARHLGEPQALGSPATRVVEELGRGGIAFARFDELFPEPGRWAEVEARTAEAVGMGNIPAHLERYARARTDPSARASGKDYLARAYANDAAILPDDPWLRLGLSDALLGVANAYLGLWSKMLYSDVWYSIPQFDATIPRVASQRWHRDPEDERLLKVFLLLREVGETSGPLEYVRGSAGDGPHSSVWRLPRGQRLRSGLRIPGVDDSYPPEGLVEARVPAADLIRCLGPAGTVVFCDTSGFHRGGLAIDAPRIQATWTYVTPAARWGHRYRLDESGGPAPLSNAARYASTPVRVRH